MAIKNFDNEPRAVDEAIETVDVISAEQALEHFQAIEALLARAPGNQYIEALAESIRASIASAQSKETVSAEAVRAELVFVVGAIKESLENSTMLVGEQEVRYTAEAKTLATEILEKIKEYLILNNIASEHDLSHSPYLKYVPNITL